MDFLLIRYSSLGDLILTTPVAENIKLNDESNRVDILTKPIYSSVFLNNPNIEDIKTGWPGRKRYDYIIDIHNSLRSNIIKYLIPSDKTLTYDKASYARRAYLYSGKYDKALKKSVIDRYLEPLKDIGIKVKERRPKLYISPEEEKQARALTGKQRYIVLSPGAKWKTKEWLEEYYSSLVKKIIRFTNFKIVITGSPKNTNLCSKIVKGAGLLKKHIVDLSGKTSIRELFAVISSAEVVITTDSAPLHIGWATGREVIALFGPTVKEFGFQPADPRVRIIEKKMDCRPCSLHGSNKCKFKDRACMKRIEPHEIMSELAEILNEEE